MHTAGQIASTAITLSKLNIKDIYINSDEYFKQLKKK